MPIERTQRGRRSACSESVTPIYGYPAPPSRDKHVSLVGATRYDRHSQSHAPRLPRCVRASA